MARIAFLGGVDVIGGTKVVVEHEGWRVLLDFGLDRLPGESLLRPPLRVPARERLAARVAAGEAPALDRVYRPGPAAQVGLAGAGDGRTALFLSHAHADHAGLAGYVDPAVPIYASAATVALLAALERAGRGLEAGPARVVAVPDGEAVAFGPFRLAVVTVDHDVPGAAGLILETPDGVVAYTGDWRLHGRHPEASRRFAALARGARALVCEGTTLSLPAAQDDPGEEAADAVFAALLADAPRGVFTCLYPHNVERAGAFLAVARAAGREILWPAKTASVLAAMGLADRALIARGAATLRAQRAAPERFVVQVETPDLWRLGTVGRRGDLFIHAGGEPLGPFDPDWRLLEAWTRQAGIPLAAAGSGGHARQSDLRWMVESVAPEVLFPVHSAAPERLAPAPGRRRRLPERGRWYDLGGQEI